MPKFSIGIVLALFLAFVASGFYFSLANFNEQREPAVPVCAWRLVKENSGALELELLGETFKVIMPSLDTRCLLEKANGTSRQLAENGGSVWAVLKDCWYRIGHKRNTDDFR